MNLDEWYGRCEASAHGVIQAVLEHLPRHGLFVDVGANVGVVSAAAIEQRDATVWAFEPHAEYAEYAQKRLPEAYVIACALGEVDDTKILHCDDADNPGWNTFVGEKRTDGMTTRIVPMRTLDSFDLAPDVVKIDTEGYETQVIQGSWNTITKHMPALVIELGWGVQHPQAAQRADVMECLFSLGYGRVDYELEGTGDVVLVA